MIFSMAVLDKIYNDSKANLEGYDIRKQELLEEVHLFELTMKQMKNHPWDSINEDDVKLDTTSPLYQNIQSAYVGDDPEEDYKEVLVWKIANMLFITAAVDHNPLFPVKWDVVVYEG